MPAYTPVVNPWIQTQEQLAAFAASLAGCRRLAVDSESDSLHHHREKVCLVQMRTDRGDSVLLDTLAVTQLDALAPAMADAGLLKILHGADYDVTTLKRDFGFRFAALFDTMIASRFLGLPEIGLQAVTLAELGIAISKDSQLADWSRRPLPPAQEAYALSDVAHLLPLHERLAAKLEALGRLSWVQEECDAVAALEPARRGRDPEGWQKIKGVKRLSRAKQAIVRELFAWRDAWAERTDIPAFKLMAGDTILAIAEAAPAQVSDLMRLKGLGPRLREHAGDLHAAVARAAALPESEWPALPSAPRPFVPEATRKRIERLRAWRAAEAARLGLDVSVVLPQRLLEKVAEAAPRTTAALEAIPGLRRWRVQALGEGLLKASA
jgi:ribonuclease D